MNDESALAAVRLMDILTNEGSEERKKSAAAWEEAEGLVGAWRKFKSCSLSRPLFSRLTLMDIDLVVKNFAEKMATLVVDADCLDA